MPKPPLIWLSLDSDLPTNDRIYVMFDGPLNNCRLSFPRVFAALYDRVAHRPAPTHRTVSVPNTHGVENVARGVTNVSPAAVAGNCLSRLARSLAMHERGENEEGRKRVTNERERSNYAKRTSSSWSRAFGKEGEKEVQKGSNGQGRIAKQQ